MLNLLKHPLLTHKLTLLRRKDTDTKDFRKTLEEIAGLMAYEITRDLPVKNVTIETPLGEPDSFCTNRPYRHVPRSCHSEANDLLLKIP